MFDRRKKAVLAGLNEDSAPDAKQDRSLKQEIDKHLQETCDLINSLPDFYTTSCCSGRVTVFADDTQGDTPAKQRGYLVYVDHDDQTDKKSASDRAAEIVQKLRDGRMSPQYDRTFEKRAADCDTVTNAWLRFEPLLIHVKARSMGAALALLKVCRSAGLKEIGVTGGEENNGYDIRIGGSVRMAVPIIWREKWTSTQDQLVQLLQLADADLFTKNSIRINAFNDAIRTLC